jgi:hypothetical protein
LRKRGLVALQRPLSSGSCLVPTIQLRRTQYNFVKAADCIRQAKYPQAEDFAAHSVLQPPSEQDSLKAFARVEIK